MRVLHACPRMMREGIQSFLMNLYRNIDREKVQFDFLVHSKEEGAFDKEIIKSQQNTHEGHAKSDKFIGRNRLKWDNQACHTVKRYN